MHHDPRRGKYHGTDGKQTFSQRVPQFKPPDFFSKPGKKESKNVASRRQRTLSHMTVHGQSVGEWDTKRETDKHGNRHCRQPKNILFTGAIDVEISIQKISTGNCTARDQFHGRFRHNRMGKQ